MKLNYTLITLTIILFTSCKMIDIKNDAPKCIKQKAKNLKQALGHACDDDATVKEYFFQNKKVYLFSPGNCGADMQSIVLSADCDELGKLGGIAGNLKINDKNFFEEAEYIKVVWKD